MKQKYIMTKAEFISWAQTKEGKHELEHSTDAMIKKRKESGDQCRFSETCLAESPPAAKLERESAAEVHIIEPDEKWVTVDEYVQNTTTCQRRRDLRR